MVASFLKMPDSLEVPPPAPEFEAPLALTRRIFTQAVLRGERRAALNIALEALDHGASMPEVYIEVFQQALYDVGSMWERNTITVAQEHMATAVTQYVMAHIFERIERPDVRRGAPSSPASPASCTRSARRWCPTCSNSTAGK